MHVAGNRNAHDGVVRGDAVPDGARQGRLRNAPSAVCDEICARLWRQVNTGARDVDGSVPADVQVSLADEAGWVLEEMQMRADLAATPKD